MRLARDWLQLVVLLPVEGSDFISLVEFYIADIIYSYQISIPIIPILYPNSPPHPIKPQPHKKYNLNPIINNKKSTIQKKDHYQ